ncbi:hypothetical protein BKA59DRAFT_552654, partial [Fusarium tricinctum]
LSFNFRSQSRSPRAVDLLTSCCNLPFTCHRHLCRRRCSCSCSCSRSCRYRTCHHFTIAIVLVIVTRLTRYLLPWIRLFLFSFLFSTVNCACCSRSHPYPRRPEPASIYQKASNVILLHS